MTMLQLVGWSFYLTSLPHPSPAIVLVPHSPPGKLHDNLDDDGLPKPGTVLREGDVMYSILNNETGKDHAGRHKDSEWAVVQTVRAIGSDVNVSAGSSRYDRTPSVVFVP